ncbi:NAD(P)-dependent oxidoreductase [Patescibacteria group bacterium]|nr:NAD(P)-dependent oxidoreductase [Patescibacteria group bacterium]MBU1075243.1 NAD(P)-dependent oxidoreductase [Patescibacteria group bacterium]MBU1952498.1 NAD(P)-dependent oxidoreductase [Patescibacteria group bacterium]
MAKKLKVGFIGLGLMGKPMAGNLLKKGFSVSGYNRSKQSLQELEKKGLKIAKNPKEVAEQSEAIILMLPSVKDSVKIIYQKSGLIEGLIKGKIVLDMSTSNPEETIKLGKRLRKKGVHLLDAPVSRGQRAAVKGDLSVMVGGEKRLFEKCLPIFKAVGTKIYYLGPLGSGLYVKALNNFTYAMNLVSATQGVKMLKQKGIDLKKAVQVIANSSGDNQALSMSINRNLGKAHPKINFYLKYMKKDVGIFNDVMKTQKVDHLFASEVSNFFKKMAKQYGEEDAMYIFEYLILQNKKVK